MMKRMEITKNKTIKKKPIFFIRSFSFHSHLSPLHLVLSISKSFCALFLILLDFILFLWCCKRRGCDNQKREKKDIVFVWCRSHVEGMIHDILIYAYNIHTWYIHDICIVHVKIKQQNMHTTISLYKKIQRRTRLSTILSSSPVHVSTF